MILSGYQMQSKDKSPKYIKKEIINHLKIEVKLSLYKLKKLFIQ